MSLALVREATHPGSEWLGQLEPGSDEWVSERRERIGGSEIAAVLGLSPFASRFSVWHRKRGNLPAGDENPVQEWGNRLESAVLDKFWAVYDHEDSPWGFQPKPGSYARVDRPWQMASPDGVLSLDGMSCALVEAKTSRDSTGWGPDGSGVIPVYYRCQVLWNLDVIGLRRAYVPVLIGGCDYREYLIDLDADNQAEEDLAILVAQGYEFMESLLYNDPPRPGDGSEATYQTIRDLHPQIDGEAVTIDQGLAGEYLAAVIAADEAELALNAQKSLVMATMGTAQYAIDSEGVPVASRSSKTLASGEKGAPFLLCNRATKKMLTARTIREALQ